MEAKGLRVNVKKTKVLVSNRDHKPQNKTGKFPCGVCGKGIGSNSILCPSCKHWIHHRCSRVRGSLSDAVNFICPSCQDGTHLASQSQPAVSLAGNSLEVVDKFCYLSDMLDAGGSAESASITRVQYGWKNFRELRRLLCSKAVSLKVKDSLFKACVQTVLLYGSETWPAKSEDIQRLDRTESAMIRRMCSSSVGDNSSSAKLRSKVGITLLTELVSRGRLRWFGHVF